MVVLGYGFGGVGKWFWWGRGMVLVARDMELMVYFLYDPRHFLFVVF